MRMKKIAELKDKDLLGLAGEAHSVPKYKARAILQNAEGLYAVCMRTIPACTRFLGEP